ncbi:MAG TPA: SgcJ/EcaC family oxidoreductase [Anaerolineae bacterium]
MNAYKPEEIYTHFAEALNAGDLDSIVALFEPEAKIVPQPGQSPVMGTEAVRQVFQGFLALQPKINLETRSVIQDGDVALLRSTWRLTGVAPDGNPIELAGNGTEVVRRQPDGTWRYVIDHPWGAD